MLLNVSEQMRSSRLDQQSPHITCARIPSVFEVCVVYEEHFWRSRVINFKLWSSRALDWSLVFLPPYPTLFPSECIGVTGACFFPLMCRGSRLGYKDLQAISERFPSRRWLPRMQLSGFPQAPNFHIATHLFKKNFKNEFHWKTFQLSLISLKSVFPLYFSLWNLW